MTSAVALSSGEGICSCEAQERLDSPASGPDWGFWLAQLLSAFTAGALCLYLLERRAWERAATLPIVESIREEDGAWGSKASTCQEPQQLNTAADETVPTLGSSTLGAASASRGLSSAVSSDDQEVECLRLMRRCVGKVHGVMSEASSKSMDGIRLTGWLGKGSFSHVYRAQWGTADVALKVPPFTSRAGTPLTSANATLFKEVFQTPPLSPSDGAVGPCPVGKRSVILNDPW